MHTLSEIQDLLGSLNDGDLAYFQALYADQYHKSVNVRAQLKSSAAQSVIDTDIRDSATKLALIHDILAYRKANDRV
jgi:hypothetical protein